MKFAKELDEDLVPEWRAKYLDYKTGKKKVKAVARAINRAVSTPQPNTNTVTSNRTSPLWKRYDKSRTGPQAEVHNDLRTPLRTSPADMASNSRPNSDNSSSSEGNNLTTPMLIPSKSRNNHQDQSLQYGSFIPTPPGARPSRFELPEPAIERNSSMSMSMSPGTIPPLGFGGREPSLSRPDSAYEIGHTKPPAKSTFDNLRSRSNKLLRHASASATPGPVRPYMARLFSNAGSTPRNRGRRADLNLDSLHRVRTQQNEFFEWMDTELAKIEDFHKSKEREAEKRLDVLRQQLHEMRDRRIQEIAELRRAKDARKKDRESPDRLGFPVEQHNRTQQEGRQNLGRVEAWMEPVERILDSAKVKAFRPRPGANSRALEAMETSPEMTRSGGHPMQPHRPNQDYVRKTIEQEVSYRSAKRKLKLALKEFYRGLELLKSYEVLNRTGFRKINKKYDKAVNAHPPLRYMSEKVNKANFVRSDVVESYLHTVEDLYARYFEKGNHKIAVGKLKSHSRHPGDFTNSAFRSGVMIGIGAVFAIQGLVSATNIETYRSDPVIQVQTSHLLQIYGGYFLALYLFSFFCLDCWIWTKNRINYAFIFELDPSSCLNWHQLGEFPSFCLLLLGLMMWLNFSLDDGSSMYIYYPVILISLTVLMIFLPAPVLFYRSRKWFIYSHWRLFLAGLYPVEFRDFFLGDMYCSLTYVMSNIELFFCLYAHHWNDPTQCGSTRSRLLGFFSTLPGIWRALQCLRRYHDTKSVFPHLVNGGKYVGTIMYYVTLSLYRIQESSTLLAVFIVFATANAIYTSIWDLVMDWSILQPDVHSLHLRKVRGYNSTWYYYVAMVLDPILRFNWIFYAIYTHSVQHRSTASFFVAFTEITRRGIWTIFRVENEHCANVIHYKASRDIPLPYNLPDRSTTTAERQSPSQEAERIEQASRPSPSLSRFRSRSTGADEAQLGSSSTLRHRSSRKFTLTRMFANAHTQDFEKKRRLGATTKETSTGDVKDDSDDGRANSSDEDDDDQDIMDALDTSSVVNGRN